VLGDITNVLAEWSVVDEAKPAAKGPAVDDAKPAAKGPAAAEDDHKSDVLNRLFTEEVAFMSPAEYMHMQPNITCNMRAILIDWIVQVHKSYQLRPETLYLTVNLIDRYLSTTVVVRRRLQLVGMAAMFIASKFEDGKDGAIRLLDLIGTSDNAYTEEDMSVMECSMLTNVGFHIVVPTAAHFFGIFQKANQCDAVHRDIAQYMMELALLDMQMLLYAPSQTAAAALLLSNSVVKRSVVWPASMVQESRHTDQALQACVDDLMRLFEADRDGTQRHLHAVHRKFSASQRHGVATMQF